jgi:hypothetical protein
MSKLVRAFAVAAVFIWGGACFHPAEERARRDLDVGHADRDGLRVRVSEGLAAIRHLSAGELWLWASAPSLEIELVRQSGAPEDWTLTVANCLPDAVLSAPAGVLGDVRDRSLATERTWQLALPANADVLIRVESPDAGLRGPFRFALMSDVQSAVDEVADLFERVNQDPLVRFVLSTGDLSSQGSSRELERFQSELEQLRVPFYTTIGNHELDTFPPKFHDYFGRANFQFEFRGVYFTLLDSASATIDPMVYDWLDGWLERGRGGIHVVTTHVPPLDPVGTRNGGFASRSEAARLLAKLADGGVDLTLYGHIHSYYRFENAGIEAHISGGGGGMPERFDGIGRHYLAVDIDPVGGVLGTQVVEID